MTRPPRGRPPRGDSPSIARLECRWTPEELDRLDRLRGPASRAEYLAGLVRAAEARSAESASPRHVELELPSSRITIRICPACEIGSPVEAWIKGRCPECGGAA